MNELINDCNESKTCAKIVKINIQLFGYCDNLVIVGPNAKHINQLLKICGEMEYKFNESKCYWMLAVEDCEICIQNPLSYYNRS